MSDASLTVGRPAVTGGEPGQTPAAGQAGSRTVDALVIGHDRAGAAILHSPEGRLTFNPNAPLAVGTRLTLLIRSDGSIRELAARPAQSGTGTPAGGDLVRVGSVSSPGGRASALPAGALLEAEILHRIMQQGGTSLLGEGRAGADLRTGELLVLRIHAAATADGREIAASRLPPDFLAKVATQGGQPRLSSAFGTLQLVGNSALPSTDRLTFRLAAPTTTPIAAHAPGFGAAAGSPPVLGNAWPALRALLADAGTGDPAVAAVVRKDLPRPGDGFVGQVLRFVLGMSAEEPLEATLARLLPQVAARAEASQILDRLGDDLQRYGRWAEPGNEWRTFVVPVADGERLAPFHLYVRDGESGGTTDPADAGVRFMVDVDLSRLGALQLDGFYRRRHLSLTVRSRRRMPQSFGDPLREVFDQAMLAAGMTGELRIESEAALIPERLGALLGDRAGRAHVKA